MNNNNSYLNVIKNLVNLNEVNENSYHQVFPVYVTSRIYQDCILKFTAPETAKLIKRSELKAEYHNNTGIFGKVGEIQNDYVKVDAYFKGSNYWIPVQEIKIKKEVRRNIAFYKESGLLWTVEEYVNCVRYSGEPLLYKEYDETTFDNLHQNVQNHDTFYNKDRKYIYDDKSSGTIFMNAWPDQNIATRDNITKLIYEEVFCDCKNIIWVD